MLNRLGLRLRVFLFFAALALGSLSAIAAGLWLGYGQAADGDLLSGFVTAGLIGGFITLGIAAWVWFLFDEHVARATERLAASLRAEAHAGLDGRTDTDLARYLGDLAPAARAISGRLSETRDALAEAVQRETTRLAEEKARLETLLSDVPVGVLLCSGDHQLVFYNGPATELLGAAQVPGLDRPIFDYLRDAPLRHAHERLWSAGDAEAVSDLLVATVAGARMLSGRMRLLDGDGAGYVLTLRDVTDDLAAHAGRDRLLEEIFDKIRRPAANLLTVIGVLDEAPDDPALTGALVGEVGQLAKTVTELGQRYDQARAGWWPLPMTRGADLLDGLRARMEAQGLQVTTEGDDLILRCDGFEIVALLAGLAERVAGKGLTRDFNVRLAEDGAGAVIDIGWRGAAVPVGTLDGWLDAPFDVGAADVTGKTVLAIHATECWPQMRDGMAILRLPIREARRAARRPQAVARRVVYDFDLLFKARAEGLAETALEDLTYVVFDTETTGLLPSDGDEIVQIAGIRIVNGRKVQGEVFDTLVNPGRPIPPRSTDVHGISDAMVADAPPIEEAGRQFHKFAEGAVLIAHNAPFDMAFLRRHEAGIGKAFDNPILDTVLLSAVVYGQGESHSLDSLTARLCITIPEEVRHTALGDTEATADAFLKLLPMLKGRGVRTFGDVLTEVRRHGRLLKDLNA
ncbi:MAG: DNA polymerase III subunit epsilon [Rhodobacteraceae bacterium]|nr:DNA polymerase III subunit epsilon [Paracoccaceae bacterium]